MKTLLATLIATAAFSTSLMAEDGALDPATLQTFRPYQLNHCLVSGDKIGAMGEGASFVYQGQEITVCCKSCIRMFAKKPAHFLAEMKKAEAATEAHHAEPAKKEAPADHHGHH